MKLKSLVSNVLIFIQQQEFLFLFFVLFFCFSFNKHILIVYGYSNFDGCMSACLLLPMNKSHLKMHVNNKVEFPCKPFVHQILAAMRTNVDEYDGGDVCMC